MSVFKKLACKFFTATILEWKYLLSNDRYKDIILDNLAFLVKDGRVYVHAFAIMDNHMHILWHIRSPYSQELVQRDFLRYSSKKIIDDLKKFNPMLLGEFKVNAKDRAYQIWERNSLTIDIWSEQVLLQKLEYIHNNPVKAGLCREAVDYKYSSARFYETGISEFGFLSSLY